MWGKYQSRHGKLKELFLKSTTDWEMFLRWPALTNLSVPETRELVSAMNTAEGTPSEFPEHVLGDPDAQSVLPKLLYPKLAENLYTTLFLFAIVVGAAGSLGSITGLADSLLFMMSIPNLIGLYILMPVARKEIFGFRKGTKDGSIEPVPEDERFGGLVTRK